MKLRNLFAAFSIMVVLAGCNAKGDNPGTEYAPNMYHSVAYEPYSQITDWDAGRWLTSIDYPVLEKYGSGHAEFFNTNMLNPVKTASGFGMNMREPAPNTVPRNARGWLPYSIPNDDEGLQMSNRLANPLDSTAAIISEGKILYETYCDHCHGAKGEGDGKVASGVTADGVEKKSYAGVPNYKSDALKNISEGHIFHVITYGKGLMQPHGSQVTPEERWKIAKYVKTLQK